MASRSPYDVLGVSQGASLEDITRAYRRLAQEWHPDVTAHDKVTAHARMVEINAAWDQLKKLHRTKQPQPAHVYGGYGNSANRPFGSWVDDLIREQANRQRPYSTPPPPPPRDRSNYYWTGFSNETEFYDTMRDIFAREAARDSARKKETPPPQSPTDELPPIVWTESANGNPTTLWKGMRATVFINFKGPRKGFWSHVINGEFGKTNFDSAADTMANAEKNLRGRWQTRREKIWREADADADD